MNDRGFADISPSIKPNYHMKSRVLHLLLAVILLPLSVFADSETPLKVTIDGISYREVPGEGMSVTGTTLNTLNIPESITVNDSTYAVTMIADFAFQNNNTLYEVSVPGTVKKIGKSAFEESRVINVNLSEGVECIYAYAFDNCKYLTEITLPSTVKWQSYCQFQGSNLIKVTFKDGITSLPQSIFSGCSALEEVNLPNTLRTIGGYAFNGCISLMDIDIPESVLEIGSGAFYGCTKLKSIDLPPLLNTINDGTFKNCEVLEKVNFSQNTMYIKEAAFEGCAMLTTVSLPEKVLQIGNIAFRSCKSLREVYIPHLITSIYSSAFSECPNLTKVHIRSKLPKSYGANLFIPKNKPEGVSYSLYVPIGTKELYQEIDTYKNFDVIEEEVIGFNMETKRTLITGTSARLNVTPVPEIYPVGTITWSSSNTAVATVDGNGNVTAINPGTAVITATGKAENENITARCTVDVIAEPTTSFVIQPTTLSVNSVVALPVEMVNESEIIAFQCDIYLSDGMGFAKDADGEYDFRYDGRESRTHVLETRLQSDGAMRVVGYSTSNAAFKSNQGTLFYIPIITPPVMGNNKIRIANILVTEKSLSELPLLDVEYELNMIGATLEGDANSDGRVTISDAAVTSAYILGDEVDNFNFLNADVVADGVITLADVSEIVNLVLGTQTTYSMRKAASRSHGVAFPTREGDKISVENITIAPGEEKEVTVSFENDEPFTSFHTEIILPEGLRFVEEDGEYFIDLDASRKTRSHTPACKLQEDGRLRALAYSSTNALFKGNDGALFTFYIVADDSFDSSKPCKIRMENNYICNRNEEGQFIDYDVNDCESIVNESLSSVTGLESDEWNVYVTDGSVLNIEAPEAAEVAIVSIDGITRMVNVDKGHNTFSGLASGFYIVKGQKLVIR